MIVFGFKLTTKNKPLDATEDWIILFIMLTVKCYASYKGEERPTVIILDNQEYFVESILRKELIEDYKTHERRTVFWCQTKDNIYKLVKFSSGFGFHDKGNSTGEWQLIETIPRQDYKI